jgi:hypothetical protein
LWIEPKTRIKDEMQVLIKMEGSRYQGVVEHKRLS